ncbi:APC family permease [Tomitella gaofuii]|uniref:APC family permease n=1 Tax=Tomitella gaofuii TaxID=2760083 RepID=UPI0015FCDF25|nr:APC family permease [Tomitella gaofuii]
MSQLKKTIGPMALVAVGAAGIIGSSFLYLTSDFFAEFGLGGTVFGMILATVFAGCVALAISELTSSFPRAGGELVFSYVAFNRGTGFIVGWLLIGIFTGIVAFYVTAAGFLVSTVAPGMNSIPLYSIGGKTVFLPVLALGIVLMLFMLAINWFGASLSFRLQLVLFLAMVVIGIVVVAVGFGAGSIDNFWPMFDASLADGSSPLSQSVSFILPALGFLTGFSIVAVMAEEAAVPAGRIGKIVVVAVMIAGAFYTVIFAATGFVLPWQETAGLDSGTIDAFKVAGFPVISWAAFSIGVIGILTTFIAVFSSVSRLIFSLARVGLLPRILSRVDERTGAPRPALIFTALVGLGLGWIGPGGLVWFLDIGGVNVSLVWIFTVGAFYRMRYKYPHLERPYRVRFVWVPAIGAIVGAALIVVSLIPGTGMELRWPAEYIMLVAWWALGAVLWFAAPRRQTPEESLRGLLGDHHDLLAAAGRDRAPVPAGSDASGPDAGNRHDQLVGES